MRLILVGLVSLSLASSAFAQKKQDKPTGPPPEFIGIGYGDGQYQVQMTIFESIAEERTKTVLVDGKEKTITYSVVIARPKLVTVKTASDALAFHTTTGKPYGAASMPGLNNWLSKRSSPARAVFFRGKLDPYYLPYLDKNTLVIVQKQEAVRSGSPPPPPPSK